MSSARVAPLRKPTKAVASESTRSVTLLGSTGSIGASSLSVIDANRDHYRIAALTAYRNVDRLIEQSRSYRPELAVIADETAYPALKDGLAGTGIEVAAGADAVSDAATLNADLVVAGIVGAAGLPSTVKAIERGATVAFANKECLVCAGPLMMSLAAHAGADLLPIDSEHNAIFQVFDFANRESIERLILTASGGPFREKTRADMAQMTPQQAVAHPVWSMGAKISVDSATMMNKGLELIEASYLFDMPSEKIDIIVHPQSIVHSMVEYIDGSVLAQMGTPDMRTPIAYALAWPQRIKACADRLDLTQIAKLEFYPPDPEQFPALRLAREALVAGGCRTTVLNAANEVAVAHFLGGRIGFLDIERVIEGTLETMAVQSLSDIDTVLSVDAEARRAAEAVVQKAA